MTVRVRPNDPNATHQISLSDGVRRFGIRLSQGAASLKEEPTYSSQVGSSASETLYGSKDPSQLEVEVRDWTAGRGFEFLRDQKDGYFDSWNTWTLTRELMHSGLQWQVSSGIRNQTLYMPGDLEWKGLYSTALHQAVNVKPSTTYNADKGYMWIRRVGTPAVLTLALCASGGATTTVGAQLKTVTLDSSNVTDIISEFHCFDWTGTQQLSTVGGSGYWLDLYGGSTADNVASHWEVGVNASETGAVLVSSATDYKAANWKPYHRVTDADKDQTFHFFFLGAERMYAVSQDLSGTTASGIYEQSTATHDWAAITASGTALDGVVEDVVVQNNIAVMARGPSTTVFRFQESGSNRQGEKDATAANIADRLHVFQDPVEGRQVWFANSTASRVYRAAPVAWSNNFVLAPSTGIPVGDATFPILEITDHDDQMFIRKADSMWTVKADRASKMPLGIDAVWETVDRTPMVSKDLNLWLAWSHSLEKLTGAVLDDIGPWLGAGLPANRAGRISCLQSGIGTLFCGIDASSGVSSVQALNNKGGYHEIFRAPSTGLKITNIAWQPISSGNPRLWIVCGGDLYYLNFPKNVLNPLKDSGMIYMHESVLTLPTIDVPMAHLPKLITDITLTTENLARQKRVMVDYQLDDDIGGNTWTEAGSANISPRDSVLIRRGDRKAIRPRVRLMTDDASTPIIVRAAVTKLNARTTVKRRWTIEAEVGTYQVDSVGLPDHKPDTVYNWMRQATNSARPLRMRSQWAAMDDIYVFAEPAPLAREYTTPQGAWGGKFLLTLREA